MSVEKLRPCPDSPNCVQSRYPGHKSHVQPITLVGESGRLPPGETVETRWRLFESVVLAQPRTRVVERKDDFLRMEFRSRIFRFVDDVEFVLDDAAGLVHLRSASRVGHYDFGVNRKRIQTIRLLWEKAMVDHSSGGS